MVLLRLPYVSISIMALYFSSFSTPSSISLCHSVQLFTGQKFLPLDVLPLYKKVSNLQECEGLQGDLGEPQGGQKIPADVTRASANRAAASAGSAGVGNQRGNTKGNADPWVCDNKVALQNRVDRTYTESAWHGALWFSSGLSEFSLSSTSHSWGRCQHI